MRKLSIVLPFIACIIAFAACEKESNDDNKLSSDQDSIFILNNSILAGDSNIYNYLNIDLEATNYLEGDSVPSTIEWFSSSSYISEPINIDKDDIFDIRVAVLGFVQNNYVVAKSFLFQNNDIIEKEIEFAVEKDKVCNVDRLMHVLKLFDKLDVIDAENEWVSNGYPNHYILSIEYEYESYFDLDIFKGEDISFNENVDHKYIGIRTKIEDSYVYGWIAVSVQDNKDMQVLGSAHSGWYEYIVD